MIKKTLWKAYLLLPLALLSACGQNPSSTSGTSSQESTASSSISPLTYGFYTVKQGVSDLSFIQGYPWINTSYEGVIGKLEKPALKDDYYLYSNYDALKDIVIPEGKMQEGGFFAAQALKNAENLDALFARKDNGLSALSKAIIAGGKASVKAEIEGLLASDEAAVRSIYASSAMFQRISKFFEIGHITDHEEIGIDFYQNQRVPGLPYLIDVVGASSLASIKADLLIVAEAEGLGEGLAPRIEAALQAIATILEKAKDADRQEKHVSTLASLDTVFGGVFNPKKALKELGVLDEQKVTYTDYIVSIAEGFDLLAQAGQWNVLRDILAVCQIADGRFLLGIKDYEEKISGKLTAMFGLSGQTPEFPEGSTDEQIARVFIEKIYPEAVKRAYYDTFVTKASRDKVTNLITDAIAEYHRIFAAATWLSQETIAKAHEKLDAMNYTVFYDDDYVSVSPYAVKEGGDAYDAFVGYGYYVASQAAAGVISNDEIGRESVDTANAFYVPAKNSFMVCHGFCSSFIDDGSLSKETLYGLLGITIGHEISHGFDSTGSLYDKDGTKQEWWSPKDRESFNEKVDKLTHFYDTKLRCFNDVPNNGKNVSGEAIADMGGVRVMTNLAEKEPGFDFDKFYSSYSLAFGYTFAEWIARNVVANEAHPLPHLRLNVTLAQFERFRKTYDIKPTDGMYIAPEDVVAIW